MGGAKGGADFNPKGKSEQEVTQNSMRMSWSHEELDRRLHTIMQEIHDKCVRYGEVNGKINYRQGANIAGFIRVAEAMLACGNL
jgi:glutamate dehydrogenase (NADP+)